MMHVMYVCMCIASMLEHGSKETKSFWKKRSELKFSIAGQGIKGAGTIPNHDFDLVVKL